MERRIKLWQNSGSHYCELEKWLIAGLENIRVESEKSTKGT